VTVTACVAVMVVVVMVVAGVGVGLDGLQPLFVREPRSKEVAMRTAVGVAVEDAAVPVGVAGRHRAIKPPRRPETKTASGRSRPEAVRFRAPAAQLGWGTMRM
jgi:hypothetical protein